MCVCVCVCGWVGVCVWVGVGVTKHRVFLLNNNKTKNIMDCNQ